jgi:hypothetical protein
MKNLLLPLVFLACPLMMMFMMRGMMRGGHDSSENRRHAQAEHHEDLSMDGQPSSARIAQLEREVASMRASHGVQPAHSRVPRS